MSAFRQPKSGHFHRLPCTLMRDCPRKSASMTTNQQEDAPHSISDEKILRGLDCLPSTDDLRSLFIAAKKMRSTAFFEAYESGLEERPKFSFNKFNLGEFLCDPLKELGIPYQDLVINLLSLILNLNALYEIFNKKGVYGGFECEIQKFHNEINIPRVAWAHPFWACGDNFGAVASCYLECVFGLEYAESDEDDYREALKNHAAASRMIGYLESQAGLGYQIGVSQHLEGARLKRHEPTIKMRGEANRLYNNLPIESKNAAKFSLKIPLIEYGERDDVGFYFKGNNIEQTIYDWLLYPNGKPKKKKIVK